MPDPAPWPRPLHRLTTAGRRVSATLTTTREKASRAASSSAGGGGGGGSGRAPKPLLMKCCQNFDMGVFPHGVGATNGIVTHLVKGSRGEVRGTEPRPFPE